MAVLYELLRRGLPAAPAPAPPERRVSRAARPTHRGPHERPRCAQPAAAAPPDLLVCGAPRCSIRASGARRPRRRARARRRDRRDRRARLARGAARAPRWVDGRGPAPSSRLRRPARAPAHARAARTRRTSSPAPARAAAGGFCAVLAMPNTDPVVDDAPVLRSLHERAAGARRACRSASSPRSPRAGRRGS